MRFLSSRSLRYSEEPDSSKFDPALQGYPEISCFPDKIFYRRDAETRRRREEMQRRFLTTDFTDGTDKKRIGFWTAPWMTGAAKGLIESRLERFGAEVT